MQHSSRGRTTRRRVALALSPLVATAGLTGVSSPASAEVTVGSNITVFPNRDMVVAVGYNAGEELTVEVLRNGVVIGIAKGPAVETPEGTGLEVNHGPLGTPQPGDCWNNTTPDIIGGDVIRVTPADNRGVDTMTVADLDFTGAPRLADDGSVVVDGTAARTTTFAVEFRRDKPDPRFRRGPFAPVRAAAPSENWSAAFRPTATSAEGLNAEQQRQIALEEASWMARADNITDTTIAELGEPGGVGPGCTGSAEPNSVTAGLEPINIASGDVTFSGTAREGVASVAIKVGALDPQEATVSTNPVGAKTWELTVPKATLATLPDGNIRVTSTFTDGLGVTVAGAPRTVVKDTVAPLAPSATPTAGTYAGTQHVALIRPTGETGKIYWNIGDATVADPDEFSSVYSAQIPVSATQTIKARVIDAAGNLGEVATARYVIGPPPAAPGGVTATEGLNSATVRWTAVTGASGYNVYRDGVAAPVNGTTPVSGTSFTDADLAHGSHSYVVRAVSAQGVESGNSAAATMVLEAPAVPAGLTATAGNAQVSLTWTAVAGAANYVVYRDGTPIVVAGTQRSYVDTARTNGTTYSYTIAARDAAGNESARSALVQATPAAPPANPTVSLATGTYTSAQTVTMTAGTGTTIRYTVGNGTTVPGDPTATSTAYTGPITVSSSQVIKAAAFSSTGVRSGVVQRAYTITIDGTAPSVTARTPAANAMSVPVANSVTATFSEAVTGAGGAALSGTNARINNAATGAAVAAAVSYNTTTRVVTVDPSANLAADTRYTVTLSGVRDAAGNVMANTTWSFTSGPAPRVASRTPAAGATAVSRTANVTATFSEAVQGVSGTTVTLTNVGTGAQVTAVVSYNATTRVVTLNPSVTLAASRQFRVNLTGGANAIRDNAGNPLASVNWTFTTGA